MTSIFFSPVELPFKAEMFQLKQANNFPVVLAIVRLYAYHFRVA